GKKGQERGGIVPRERLDAVGKRMEDRFVQLRDEVGQSDALSRAGKISSGTMSTNEHLAVSRTYTAFIHQVDVILEAMLRHMVTCGED
ncbi:MAG: hypothetical protein Q7U96_01275, partial [Chloroflexota bacterium]|nr:hypothetical protein [Chloroflexota bacterium]